MTLNLTDIKNGIIAGFIATVVLTIVMLFKNMMGIMPELDPVLMISIMVADNMGAEPNIIVGWVCHFMIGSLAWGSAFAVLNDHIPAKTQVKKGIILGITAWLAMMVGLMPLSGSGLFGLNLGPMAPVSTFILHIIYGVALGMVYARLITK